MRKPLPPAPAKAYDPSTYLGRVGAYAGQIHEVRWGYYKGWPHGQVRRAIGYVPRVKGSMQALGYDAGRLHVILNQMVALTRNGMPSRRSHSI